VNTTDATDAAVRTVVTTVKRLILLFVALRGASMHLRFQRRPWDILLVLSYTIVLAPVLFISQLGHSFGLLLIIFVPGYVVVAALFPATGELDWIERIALSLGLSLAIVPLLGLVLNFTAWGIRFAPVVATIAIFTTSTGGAAYWRRMRLPPSQRLALTIDLAVPGQAGGPIDAGLSIAIAASVILAAGTLVYIVTTPRPGERFTEFYVTGPSGNATGYPTALNVSEAGSVILAVTNHESINANYTLRIDLVGVQLVYNATSGYNETVELNRTTWSSFNITLANGKTWTQSYAFSINSTGLWKVQFLLFTDGNFSVSYRELHLYVRVI